MSAPAEGKLLKGIMNGWMASAMLQIPHKKVYLYGNL
jgi:hypothetical protein